MDGKLRDNFGALDENTDNKYVIVTNLDESIDDYDLREKFEKFGHVPHIQLPFQTEPKFGKCARLEFALAPAARAACSKLGGKSWRGQRIQAYTYDRWKRMLASKGMHNRATFQKVQVKNKVFVGGLGQSINVHMMRRYFQQYGPIDFRQSKVIMDRSGKSKGYGFVVYENQHHAQSVLTQTLHWIEGKSINVGPVHEKRLISSGMSNPPPQPPPPQQQPDPETKKSRSRSYSSGSKSGSSSSRSRSRSSSKEKEVKEVVQPILGEPEEAPEEPEQNEEEYQREVEKQAAKIEEAEQKAKTLQQRRAERRARWKRKAAKSPGT